MTHRWIVGLIVVTALLAGCGETAPVAKDKATRTASASSTPSPTPSADNSVADKLTAAGVPDEVADQLVGAANRYGYGPADRAFASVFIDVCRDVAVGQKSWKGLTAQDVADGAPAADAKGFNNFVRDRFCPSVKAARDVAPSTAPTSAIPSKSLTRGLLSHAKQLGRQVQTISYAPCRKATGAPLGTGVAFRTKSKALVCDSYLDGGPWGDIVIDLDLVFTDRTTEKQALAVAQKLLPADAKRGDRRLGHNAPYANRSGSCVSVLYKSSTISKVLRDEAPKGWGQSPEVTAVLYSDRSTEYGSADNFDGKVSVLALGIGGHNTAYKSNTVTC